jgi:hypothetical protein
MWMPLTLGAMALGALGVAARGLATNRPFVYSPRWFLAAMSAVFCANFGLAVRHAARAPLPSGQIDVQALFLPGLLAVVTLLLLIQLRGFLAVGVSGPLFREALFVSIKKLGLPFEQHFSIVRLPSVGTELRMSVQAFTGTAQIKLRRVRGERALKDIARGMNGYFQSRKIAASSISCLYYLALAVTLAIMAFELWPA